MKKSGVVSNGSATVLAYIRRAAPPARPKLRQMRTCIRATAPGAQEGLKWSMPAVFGRRIYVMYAAFQRHVGFFPTPGAVKAFAKDLKAFKTGRGSIQFPLEQPLPLGLIRKMTAWRVRQALEQDGKWKTGGRCPPRSRQAED